MCAVRCRFPDQLGTLALAKCGRVTDTGLRHLARLRMLTTLRLASLPHIKDYVGQLVAALPRVTTCTLVGCTRVPAACRACVDEQLALRAA